MFKHGQDQGTEQNRTKPMFSSIKNNKKCKKFSDNFPTGNSLTSSAILLMLHMLLTMCHHFPNLACITTEKFNPTFHDKKIKKWFPIHHLVTELQTNMPLWLGYCIQFILLYLVLDSIHIFYIYHRRTHTMDEQYFLSSFWTMDYISIHGTT